MKLLLNSSLILLLLSACNGTEHPQTSNDTSSGGVAIPPIITYSILTTHPHDTAYFTEGLEFYNDQLLESSGGNKEESPYPSAAGIANLKTGKVDTKITLDRAKYFGEGITVFNDKLYMLTWTSEVGFVFDAKTFKKISEFKLPTKQGWGLTHDSSSIIMSSGTNSLHFLDPVSLKVKNILGVTDNNGAVGNINELEYVDGFIYANQWTTSYILKIDAASGKVVGRIDLDSINSEIENKYFNNYGLNGIAYNKKNNSFIIAGKKWPLYYEIRLQ